jgi:hypothetical protein
MQVHPLLTFVTGLAVGFAVGREVSATASPPGAPTSGSAVAAPVTPAPRRQEVPRSEPVKVASPTRPVFVAVAPHNVRKGPWPAKVTLVEFSDFQ